LVERSQQGGADRKDRRLTIADEADVRDPDLPVGAQLLQRRVLMR
jgi:hypothetical protein